MAGPVLASFVQLASDVANTGKKIRNVLRAAQLLSDGSYADVYQQVVALANPDGSLQDVQALQDVLQNILAEARLERRLLAQKMGNAVLALDAPARDVNGDGVMAYSAVTGTGDDVLATAPTIKSPVFTGSASGQSGLVGGNQNATGPVVRIDGIAGDAPYPGLEILNTIHATAAEPIQRSPGFVATSEAWNGSASKKASWGLFSRPVSGTEPITSEARLSSSIDGSGFATKFIFKSTGEAQVQGAVTLIGGTSGDGVPTYVSGVMSLKAAPTIAQVLTSESSTSATYADLTTPGPSVTVTTDTTAEVTISVRMVQSAGSPVVVYAGVAVSGATTIAASDTNAVWIYDPNGAGVGWFAQRTFILTGLTPGSNTFKLQYKSNGSNNANWVSRVLKVTPL